MKDTVGVLNMSVLQNERLSRTLTWLNDDGTPVDLLTDYSDMKWSFFFGDNQLDLTIGSGITISGADNRDMTFAIDETTTEPIPAGRYYHELLMIDSSGVNDYTIKGIVEVIKTQTRITS
jgi:hypothetical protein